MLLFLAFCSRSVERSERSSQTNTLSSLAELLSYFISLTFDSISEILEVALRHKITGSVNFFLFCRLYHIV